MAILKLDFFGTAFGWILRVIAFEVLFCAAFNAVIRF
ncbi:Uncharacterised protein [Salmonella enterica subsp. enterica serovar Typhi]|nr:Uncharacterised protein [Salmonella enterica subsp. enterica serovar Typhi]CGU74869.1 Uncharacterised protein [Salmonella enterica subsp. enterica serovar Typhi]CGU82840.1 Uncharacterised protein [Salmonella enterica subsp. enterica serovar Typhi]CHX02042.1 Uncharacterised protein [Salmonella enterica subsp. enterica serovar Typhi]CIH95865.1 Uncharacterised protein [Salmonella enterica subsp. enterica serovar Typhi]